MSLIAQTSLKDFTIIKSLGKGSFSSVYLVKRNQDSKIYALKRVYLDKQTKKQQESSVNEVRILASIHHQNVISYKEAFWDDNTSSLNIVMEYADDGDLYTKLKKMKQEKIFFEEKQIWDYAIQLIQGLKSLHDKNIMHRDLKSENIFLFKKNSQCKIGDMNVSKVLKEKLLRTQTGTPYYASPEVWMNKPYSFKSDLWSIGCVIYEMCELKTPFTGKDMDELFINICLNKTQRINEKYSNDLWFMIKKLLEVNVDKRFNCAQFLESDIVKKKNIELRNYNNNAPEINDNDNSLLLNTIVFSDIKDIKRQLPNKKYYNEESTTESNSKKEKENLKENNISNNNTFLIKELRKELENMKVKQELRKKEKKLLLNNNLEKNRIKQRIKQWDITFKNVKIKNKLKIPINCNLIRRNQNQINEISKINYSSQNIKSYNDINKFKSKNNINYRNSNMNRYIYDKNRYKSFTLNKTKENNQKNNSFSYNIDKNNISNNKICNKNIHCKLFNKLKFLKISKLINTEENKMDNNDILKDKKTSDNSKININFNFIPNNYQSYINNNDRYTKKIINNKTNNSSINISKERFNSYNKYVNSTKENLKANSHKKLLEINIDSNLSRIKNILNRNQNLKFKNILIKHKSFSERENKIGVINISKKKIISKKHFLINKIPKSNAANTNRNGLKIPYYFKQLNTCNNLEIINPNKKYLL